MGIRFVSFLFQLLPSFFAFTILLGINKKRQP